MTREQLSELVFTALGEASMCWIPAPSNQVFDSTKAKEIGEKLTDAIWHEIEQHITRTKGLADIVNLRADRIRELQKLKGVLEAHIADLSKQLPVPTNITPA